MNDNKTTITVFKSTWKKLYIMKAEKDLATIDDVISELIKNEI